MYNQKKILRVLQLIQQLRAKPPKRIRTLASTLSTTERTVYRYIDLLTELGFVVDKDDQNRLYIPGAGDDISFQFTDDESHLIQQLLKSVGKDHPLRDGILKKLITQSDHRIKVDHLLKAHLGQLIEQLSKGIAEKRQTILKDYHSVNSNKISNRLVEPICFTDNYNYLVAFELSSEQNKYFRLERIAFVDITNKPFKNGHKHKFESPDAFGFSSSDKKWTVDMLISIRAQILLKERFPMTVSYLTFDKDHELYRFKAEVNDLKPITGFVLSMSQEIRVLGSEEFKAHLHTQLQNLISNSKI